MPVHTPNNQEQEVKVRKLRDEPRLFLIPKRTERHSLVELWHLCSLDAPSVAALWTWFVAYACGTHVPWTSVASMFLAVWMLYAGDRLLDARVEGKGRHLLARHHFHARYRNAFVAVIALSSCVLAGLLLRLTTLELRLFACLGSLLFAYFFLIHICSFRPDTMNAQYRLPKEFAVGLFFAAAIFVPTVSRAPALRSSLLIPATLFAMVCTLNCLYVFAWEHPKDLSEAHCMTAHAVRKLDVLSIATLLCCVFFALFTRWMAGTCAVAVACGVSVLVLCGLNRFRNRISALLLRACADLALLSPLVLVPAMANFRR